MKKSGLLFAFFFLLCGSFLFAQATIKQTINSNWEFHKGDITGYPATGADTVRWQKVSIPHSWNTNDVNDDNPGYYRGISWYRKTVFIPAAWKEKCIYLYFEGANQVAEVYVNGKFAGKHIGGYTAFCFRVSGLLHYGDKPAANEIEVKLDNNANEDIPPLNADFTFFGGIYRDVYLLSANQVHFDIDSNAAFGIRIKTPRVSAKSADVEADGTVVNANGEKQSVKVISEIFDAQGRPVASAENKLVIPANGDMPYVQHFKTIANPHLWSPDDPYLYRVVSSIYDDNGKLIDRESNPLGLRWFRFDAATGFYLNGKHLKLIGANRHQEFKGMANALPDAIHERDMELLKNMGANFIRISHYPQDPAVLQACDRLGLLASMEIPIVNRITQSAAFTRNCERMQQEMIGQNFNHPCIIIWAYMNEVLLQPRYDKNSLERQQYYRDVDKLAGSLDSLTHQDDPSRYTMISCHGDFDLYNNAGITKIPQIVGWNLYYGWYAPDFAGFSKFIERHHQVLPDKPVIITEYGADGDTRLHSFNPIRFDKTMEYQILFHQNTLKQIMAMPCIAGAAAWCLVDFNSEARIEAAPHTNTKGLATETREPKDVYYYYQANLLKRPFIKIGSRNWTLRSGIADSRYTCVQPVEVYSNLPSVSLWLNGKLLATKAVNDKIARFDVPFKNGRNTLSASCVQNGTKYEDFTDIRFKMIPVALKDKKLPFTELNVSLGDARFYVDNKLQQVWLPEKPYTPGSWGYVGGRVFSMRDNALQRYGTNKNILGTDYDPIYATQRVGLSDFKLDVPDGKYEVTLLFAELVSAKQQQASVYNLGHGAQNDTSANRSFDVLINGQKMLSGLGDDNVLQPERAYSEKYTIEVDGETGIDIHFVPLKGLAILNGVQVKRID